MLGRWYRKIRIGDVLRSGGGSLRVVRDVKHFADGKTFVHLVIKHCSWTGRCYTVLQGTDLNYMGYRRTGKRVRLRSKLDAKIAEACRSVPITLTCCDVEGLS